MQSTLKFGDLLTSAVRKIKAIEDKNLDVIQDELGYALNHAGSSFISYLRKGHLPAVLDETEHLATILVQRQGLDRTDCEQFLSSAGHPQAKLVTQRLFPTAPLPSTSARERPLDLFVTGPPILHPRQFFGRTRHLQRIFGWLRGFPLEHISISGPRRSGKTSLLHHLRTITTAPPASLRPQQKQDWLPHPHSYRWVWVDFQDARMRRQESLLRYLLTGFGCTAPTPCTLDDFLDSVMVHDWSQPTIVLMDELNAGLAAPELDKYFWWGLRSLLNAPFAGNLSFIVASSPTSEPLSEECSKASPFANLLNNVELGPFYEAEAREVIASSPLPFASADVDWIVAQSSCWPLFVQILCQERLLALQVGDASQEWQEAGLRRVSPHRHLLSKVEMR